jgi:predicted DsbA family dithiol-disulfide isomerase
MRIDVWSDVVCPWCYIGFVRLNKVLDGIEGDIEIYYHSFQLDKDAENSGKLSVQYLAEKYGIQIDDAKGMSRQVSAIAEGDGLHYQLEKTLQGNTRFAHRLLHLAAELGLQKKLLSLLFHSYFEKAFPIFTPDELKVFATEVGISEEDFARLTRSDEFEDIVDFDFQLARDLQIQGVPFFVFNQSVAVAGAESEEILKAALEKAREFEDSRTTME